MQQIRRGLGQRAARRHDARDFMSDALPVAVFAQAVEHRRTGNPHHFFMRRRVGEQVFRINRLPPRHRPAHCQRKREAESKAVKVLRNDAADNRFPAASEWQRVRQHQGFRLHLRGSFHNHLRLAAGTRRFQPRLGMVGNQMIFRGGRRVFRRRVCRQIGQVPHGWVGLHI